MNKTEFLDELRKHLIVLENNEQRDILDEYSQHIDMKIERGLSEEEAINDFGSVEELAAQILEAYHVNPEYEKAGAGEEKKKKMPDLTAFAATGKKAGGTIGHILRKLGNLLHNGTVRLIKYGKITGKKVWAVLTIPFHWGAECIRKIRLQQEEETGFSTDFPSDSSDADAGFIRKQRRNTAGSAHQISRRPKSTESGPSLFGRVIGSIGHFLAACCSIVWALFLWGIRWCWNGAIIFVCLFSGAMILFSVFSFAMLIVWLLQGYPIAGITVFCFGAILCSVSFTVLCLSLLKLKPHNKKAEAPVLPERSEEADYA